jgi:parvulin-like peptidyl-prolyl isomerase
LWQGPFRSAFGEHLVMLTEREQRRLPELNEVRGDVERDYVNQQTSAILTELTQTIRERYRIEIEDIRLPAAP